MRSVLALVFVALTASYAGAAGGMTSGHSARLLTSGELGFAARRANILSADTILYKTYAFVDDETGRETVQLLADRARAGAKVFVQYDVKGTTKSIPSLLGIALGIVSPIPHHLQPLVDAGVTLVPTSTPTLASPFLNRDHDKLLITCKAGRTPIAILGGMNIGDKYAWSGLWRNKPRKDTAMRDTDAEVIGPVVVDIIGAFVDAARRANTPSIDRIVAAANDIVARSPIRTEGIYHARYVRNDPKAGTNGHAIEALYEELLEEVPPGDTVTFSNAYTLPPKRLRQAMIRAAARGVKFRLLVNGVDVKESEARLLALAFRDHLRSLFTKIPGDQLEVIEFSANDVRNEASLHQKIAKFGTDGPVLVGSHNLDELSATSNGESALVLAHHRIAQQFDALIDRSLREGKVQHITVESLRRDSAWTKTKGFILNRGFRKLL